VKGNSATGDVLSSDHAPVAGISVVGATSVSHAPGIIARVYCAAGVMSARVRDMSNVPTAAGDAPATETTTDCGNADALSNAKTVGVEVAPTRESRHVVAVHEVSTRMVGAHVPIGVARKVAR
jgi:hypothetical protein